MKRRSIALLLRVLIIGFFTIAYPSQKSFATHLNSICTDEISVMPLGDSITTGKYSGHDTSDTSQGALDDIGYRMDLRNLLTAGGFNVDFVGTESNGSTFPFSDPEHEGHNGWTDAQIAENIYNNGGEKWLIQNPPDVVLLHIGTNSLAPNPSDVESILDEIDEYEGDTGKRVIVIVARIIDWAPNNPVVNQFNNNVEAMVTGRLDYGQDLLIVDMEDGAGLNYSIYSSADPDGDMFNKLHPFKTGYTKMAAVWKAAFDELCSYVYLPIVLQVSGSRRYLWE